MVVWLEDLRADDVGTAGGKAASLGELVAAGFQVPDAFVVTAETYREAIETAGIAEELDAAVAVDIEESDDLRDAAADAAALIETMELPEDVRESIMAAYAELGEDVPVAVRSSALAEDQPDASFAGQQETFLNVTGEDLLERIKACWASLYTQRAIYYRDRQGYASEVDIAVVVQRMVDADKSGVMFTAHPSTDENSLIIEAAWGLGEAVVSGSVTPDQYTLDRSTGEIRDRTIATKARQVVRDPESGDTVEEDVPPDKRDAAVLSPAELGDLYDLGDRIAEHYGNPQDVEWAIEDDEVYLLQSRPITTIEDRDERARPAETNDEVDEPLVSGLGASPGIASGPATLVTRLDHLDQVEEGDILVTEMTTPDMVPAMQRAVAIVTDEGGMTSHAAIISRELGVPAVTGTGTATEILSDGQRIRVDGEKGTVSKAPDEPADGEEAAEAEPARAAVGKPMTATEVKVNVSIPSAAERAAATGADGVGLLRLEHLVLTLGKTPERYIADTSERAYQDRLLSGVRTVADAFYPRQVRVRTLDAPTDEFRELDGGEDEPDEHNPMLGYRGIRRSLDKPAVFRQELEALARLQGMGYDNIEVMFPLVGDERDVIAARDHMEAAGIDPDRQSWGVMIETPGSALCIDEIIETGIDFVSFGTNDLTQYTLAVDRNNAAVADRFDEMHPAVRELIETTIATCRDHGVDTSVCGEAASRPEVVRFLVRAGVTSVSPNIDAVQDVQETVKRVEQRLLLDAVR